MGFQFDPVSFGMTFVFIMVLLLAKTKQCSPIKEIFSVFVAMYAALVVGTAVPVLIDRPYGFLVVVAIVALVATITRFWKRALSKEDLKPLWKKFERDQHEYEKKKKRFEESPRGQMQKDREKELLQKYLKELNEKAIKERAQIPK